MLKKCNKCGATKPLDGFYFNKPKGEYYSPCLDCNKEVHRIYYYLHKEKIKASNKKYREKNKDRLRLSKIKWKKNNPEKVKSYAVKTRIKRKLSPKLRLQHCMTSRVGQSLKGNKKGNHWEFIVGYTLSDLQQHLEKQFKDGMSWANYGKWHIDHIRPVASFDFSKPEDEQFKQCWSLSNLQPLWAKDNCSKNDKWNDEREKVA